ncbi:hypothetical protein E2C01_004452 [Portunus trituberculatus]|uniref:Uncharacterized protein n=1 Tax=Portunus trituberculatus TaxID=210409 RepID=A0A5B7CPU9_PORTR|nr:hypothetical protein [Portunus trituberculatus]
MSPKTRPDRDGRVHQVPRPQRESPEPVMVHRGSETGECREGASPRPFVPSYYSSPASLPRCLLFNNNNSSNKLKSMMQS